ncbi:CRISPR-associated endonuclease Cas2 [Xanthomarina sp.]|uniref:CRISPR-associated endonuclease Cas2 n=1 Tax=Xanthomarina sp. TaxID=1931211 RepID=UPI002C9745BA|nr:CRISPR-associated endonuclease Cas2 [Xanthomarina sp.]HLV40458.1 CRISPR-associated endonuclease Cas2 [Xanthomarina sp.]
MLLISYDIKDDKLRTAFSKMIRANGAIRLQYSVYEINNTKRILDLIKIEIKHTFSKQFSADDSIFIAEFDESKVIKYGNAIHRDKDLLFF